MLRLSLRTKLLAGFIAILLPILVLLVYGYREANEQRVQTILDTQMQTAQAIALLIDASFDEALVLGLSFTHNPVILTLDPAQLDPYLEGLAPLYPQYEGIAVLNAAGDNVGTSAPFPPGTERKGLALDRPYFQQVMATGKPVISPVLISRVSLRPSVVVAVPIRNEAEQLTGIIIIGVYVESLSERLQNVALTQEQNIFLADQTGTAAFYTALPDLPWEQRSLTDFEPVQEALEGRPTKARRFVSPLLGDTRLGAFAPTPQYGWVVGVSIREDVALAPVAAALRDQLLGFSAVAILTAALSLLIASRLLEPIRRLIHQVRALGRGDLSRRVDIRTGDEMEDLGQTFNKMADRLGRTLTDLRAVLEAVESGILMYDRDFLIRLVNRRVGEWFDLDPAAVIGQPLDSVARDLIAPKLADPTKLLSQLDRLRENPEEVIIQEVEVVRPEYRVLRLYVGPVRIDGERIGHIDVYTDITEVRRREEERKALGQLAEALVRERTLEGVAEVAVDRGRHVLRASVVGLHLVNPKGQELRLVAHRGLSEQGAAELGVISLNTPFLAAQVARTGKPQEIPDTRALTPNLSDALRLAKLEGQRSLFAQPLFAKGHLVGVLTIAKTTPYQFSQWEREIIRAFADLCAIAVENARLYEDLRETLHLRDEFLTVAAHELRTPITALRGFTQLLLRSKAPRPPEERKSLEAIERQTKRITRLVEDLFETVGPSSVVLQVKVIDLAALVEEAVREIGELSEQHRPILCRMGPVMVKADPTLIRRVLVTLMDNSIRFSPQGGRIEVTVATQEGMALVSIRDYGLGIPQERQTHVFEPFYEPYPAGTPGYTGATGLGLYVAKTIVERHGGLIWFESKEGKGSTFFFTLPLA